MQALWVLCRLSIRYRWKVVGVFGLLQICCCCLVAVVSDPLRLHGPYPTRLLCSWDCPGKKTGVSCHFLLQGIFLTQGSNLPLLHWQADCLPLNHQGRPYCRSAAAAAKSLQSCPTLRPHRRQPTRLPHPWDSPGKNTGVGRHFLLQCMKVKSESEVAQSCPTLSDPMHCSLPGSSVHGIFQAYWSINQMT